MTNFGLDDDYRSGQIGHNPIIIILLRYFSRIPDAIDTSKSNFFSSPPPYYYYCKPRRTYHRFNNPVGIGAAVCAYPRIPLCTSILYVYHTRGHNIIPIIIVAVVVVVVVVYNNKKYKREINAGPADRRSVTSLRQYHYVFENHHFSPRPRSAWVPTVLCVNCSVFIRINNSEKINSAGENYYSTIGYIFHFRANTHTHTQMLRAPRRR